MPRKPVDIRPSDYPVSQKRGNCTLFLPSGEDGCGQRPLMGQGTGPLWGLGQGPKVLNHQYLQFSRFDRAYFFGSVFFIDYLTLPPKEKQAAGSGSQKQFPKCPLSQIVDIFPEEAHSFPL